MKDPWYSKMTSSSGKQISGTAAFLHRNKLEGGPTNILSKVAQKAVENTMQNITENFHLIPKKQSKLK